MMYDKKRHLHHISFLCLSCCQQAEAHLHRSKSKEKKKMFSPHCCYAAAATHVCSQVSQMHKKTRWREEDPTVSQEKETWNWVKRVNASYYCLMVLSFPHHRPPLYLYDTVEYMNFLIVGNQFNQGKWLFISFIEVLPNESSKTQKPCKYKEHSHNYNCKTNSVFAFARFASALSICLH